MEVLETLFNEMIGFLGITQVLELLKAGDYEAFKTYDGIVSLIVPIIPLLVILELILGLIYKNPQAKVYKVNFLIYIFNRFVGRFIAIAMVALCIGLFQHLAPFQTSYLVLVYLWIHCLGVWAFSLSLLGPQSAAFLVSAFYTSRSGKYESYSNLCPLLFRSSLRRYYSYNRLYFAGCDAMQHS